MTLQETSRRRVAAGIGITVAALAGAAWLRIRKEMPQSRVISQWRVSQVEWRASQTAQEAVRRLWTLTFEQPDGSAVEMSDFRGKPLLVNFWASWCPYCWEEMPRLNRFYAKNRANDWELLGLAVDRASAVQSFLRRSPVDFPIGIAQENGLDLLRQLSGEAGLPFLVLFDADGAPRRRAPAGGDDEDLAGWRNTLQSWRSGSN